MQPIGSDLGYIYPQSHLPVVLDGKLLGYIDPNKTIKFVKKLREYKINKDSNEEYKCVSKTMEIAFLPSN